MSRMRTLKPDFFTDSKIVRCSPLARLFFQGSWCFSDDNGILPDDMLQLKIQVLPADNCNPEELKCELIHNGLWIPYVSGDKPFLLIRGFSKHQVVQKPMTVHPLPDAETLKSIGLSVKKTTYLRNREKITVSVLFPEYSENGMGIFPEYSVQDVDVDVDVERKGEDGKRRGCRGRKKATAPSLPSSPPSDLDGLPQFQLDPDLCRDWPTRFAAWKTAYPDVDVLAEVRAAHQWLVDHPDEKRPRKARFIAAWLANIRRYGGTPKAQTFSKSEW